MGWMKILSINNGTAAYGNGNNHTVIDAVNNYFFLTNHCEYDDGSNRYSRGFKRTASTTIRVDTFIYQSSVPEGAPIRWYDDYTLIEVAKP